MSIMASPVAALAGGTAFGDATLYHGDCMQILPALAGMELAACITDPPYGCTDNSWDKMPDLPALWASLWPALRANGATVFTAQGLFFVELVASQKRHFRYELIYQKQNVSGFLSARYMPMRKHELIAVFCRQGTVYNPQCVRRDKLARKRRTGIGSTNYGTSGPKWEAIQANGGVLVTYTHNQPLSIITPAEYGKGARKRRDGGHPTEKPVGLMEWLVKTYTNPGDTVLDPFMGSGTTGVAALNCGRKFIGIELDAHWYNAACKRIEAAWRNRQGSLLENVG